MSLVRIFDSVILDFERKGRQNSQATSRRASRLTGLNLSLSTLLLLEQMKGHAAMRITDLAEAVCVAKATVTRQVDELEKQGLVTRNSDQHDARASLVQITEKGQKAADLLARARLKVLQRILERWNESDLKQLTVTFERLQADMQRVWQQDADDIYDPGLWGAKTTPRPGTRAATRPAGHAV
jgi:DNA-binding MarR family transcriptional regulator